MKDWFRRFFAVDNSINENTVMGVLAFVSALGFGIAGQLPAMGAFLGYSAACFGLNWKFKS